MRPLPVKYWLKYIFGAHYNPQKHEHYYFWQRWRLVTEYPIDVMKNSLRFPAVAPFSCTTSHCFNFPAQRTHLCVHFQTRHHILKHRESSFFKSTVQACTFTFIHSTSAWIQEHTSFWLLWSKYLLSTRWLFIYFFSFFTCHIMFILSQSFLTLIINFRKLN